MKVLLKYPSLSIVLLCFALSSVILNFSCKKQTHSKADYSNSVSETKNWFENNVVRKENKILETSSSSLPKDTYKPSFSRMRKLSSLLKWSEAKEYKEEDLQYIVVPLEQNIKPLKNQNFEALRGVVFYKDDDNNMHMNIIEAISKKEGRLENNTQEISSVAFSNKLLHRNAAIKNMTASIIFYDENYRFQSSYKTTNGNWSKANIKLVNRKGSVTKKRPLSTISQQTSCQGCTKWYLIGYWFDLQSGQVVDSEILSEWDDCENGSADTGYGENPPIKIDDDCSVTGNEELSNLYSSATTSDQIESITPLEDFQDIRTKKYQWIILRSVGWYLFSWEKGSHLRTGNPNPHLAWRWLSLEHISIGMAGIVIGGNIDYKLISATPTIGLYNAIMDLDFEVKYSVFCKGSPMSTTLVYNSSRNFHIND